MTDVRFVPNITPITADWLNDANTVINHLSPLSTSAGAALVGIIQPSTGAVLRTAEDKLLEASVSAEDFGAVGDDPTHDDWDGLQEAVNTGKRVKLLGKTYYISKPLEAEYYNLEAAGWGSSLTPTTAKTLIKKTTHTLGTHATVNGISYAVDSVISIVHPTDSFSNGWSLKGVSFEGISDGDRNAYVLYAPRISQFSMGNVALGFGTNGFYSTSAWDARFNHVQAFNCTTGWNVVNGAGSTSWTANNISALSCTHGFSIVDLQYSTFNSCYAEGSTQSMWNFTASKNVVLNGCGGESPTGSLLSINSSNIALVAWQSGTITGLSGVSAIEVADSELTLINSIFQDFSSVNGAKNMTITGSGSPSKLYAINTAIPILGATSTVDGNSVYVQDTTAGVAAVRGKQSQMALVVESTDNVTGVFFKNGVFSTAGTPTCTFKQINNTVVFTVRITCTVSGAGAGTIILDVPFTLAANSVFGTAFAGGNAAPVYRYAATQIRADLTAAAGATEIVFSGTMNL